MSHIPSIRILIAEDHLIARVGVKTIINAQPDMTVVAEAANGLQAVELYRKHRPDVSLMDVRMPEMSGVEATHAIRAEFPEARIIALSTYGGDEDIRRALQAGARAYLTKDVLHDELIRAIHAVHSGGNYLPPGVAAALESSALPGRFERAGSGSAGADREGLRQQANRVRAGHRRAHRQEPREEHSEQVERGRSDASGDGGDSARDYSFVNGVATGGDTARKSCVRHKAAPGPNK